MREEEEEKEEVFGRKEMKKTDHSKDLDSAGWLILQLILKK